MPTLFHEDGTDCSSVATAYLKYKQQW